MLNIEYTSEPISGEPGPNFYWRGVPGDYLDLIAIMRHLGVRNGESMSISHLPNVTVDNGILITASSSQNGKILVSSDHNRILMDLDCSLWRDVIIQFAIISFTPGHQYVDFDGFGLRSDANFIISSEGN